MVSKTDEQHPQAADQMPPSSPATSGPSSLVVVTKATSGLVACDHAKARACAHRVI
jgi:hypothetical protein